MQPKGIRTGIVKCSLAVLVLATVLAGCVGGVQASHGDGHGVWTVRVGVDATVVDSYATVNVTARIANEGPDPEFPFAVRIPDGAYVTGLKIVRDGEVHTAEIRPRDRARQAYEDAKSEGRTAGLVEKTRGSSVYRYLVNVEGFETVTATLTYEMALSADRGVHKLPLEAPVSSLGEDRGASFDVAIRHSDGVSNAWGTPDADATPRNGTWHLHHEVGPREGEQPTTFNASYALEPTGGNGSLATAVRNGTGYFVHRFRAPADRAELPLDLTLVLDTSGSMGGRKIAQLQDAAKQVVQRLDTDDRLQIVTFSSDAQARWSGLEAVTPDRRSEATTTLDRLTATGGTNIADGVRTGLDAFGDDATGERVPILVVLTDGQATSGVQDPGRIREIARQENRANASVYGLAFGSDADWSLVYDLAEDGDGVAYRVPAGQGAEVDIRRLLVALTTPVLTDLRIRYEGDVDVLHRSASTLFKGSGLLIAGTYDASMQTIRATVEANASDGPRTYDVVHPTTEPVPEVARLVASRRIGALEARIDAKGPAPELVDRATELALEHGFVTERTSLVVALPDDPDGSSGGDPVRSGDRARRGRSDRHDGGARRPTIPGFETAALVGATGAALSLLRRD